MRIEHILIASRAQAGRDPEGAVDAVAPNATLAAEAKRRLFAAARHALNAVSPAFCPTSELMWSTAITMTEDEIIAANREMHPRDWHARRNADLLASGQPLPVNHGQEYGL